MVKYIMNNLGEIKENPALFDISIWMATFRFKNVHRSGELEKDSSRLKILPKQV